MPVFTRDHAHIYFEDYGTGVPIIAVHGLIENATYWNGLLEDLTKRHRFIPMDMRGHGRTVVDKEPYGFDADTVGDDIIALADYLKIERFHLLTHSTGGFAGVRYAMRDSGRLAGLILTDTASATAVLPGDAKFIKSYHDKMARYFERFEWDQIIANLWVYPAPFFRGVVESTQAKELMNKAFEMVKLGDRAAIGKFVRSFYTDPDPRIEGLRAIRCPALIIYGEKDDLFIEPGKLMAREIPAAKLIEYPDVGHMTALEIPQRLAQDIIEFVNLNSV